MLQKPFKEPFKIDSKFGEKRIYGYHSGEDWNGTGGGNTDCGYKLYPITKGEVVYNSSSTKGYGNITVYRIEGPWGVRWIRYCHCRQVIAKGGLVTPETLIATLGTTGNSTACHLHWDVIKKPMSNWRMYAKTRAILNEYFEEPSAFFNMWKDTEEENNMPKWFETLLNENNLSLEKDESKIRALFDKAKRYDDEVNSYQEKIKSVNEALADRAREVSLLTEENQKLTDRVTEAEEESNKYRGERDKEAWEKEKCEIQIKGLEEEIEDLENQIDKHETNNDIMAYSWSERFRSLFSRDKKKKKKDDKSKLIKERQI